MTLDEIRVLLNYRDMPGEDCTGVNTLLDKHIGHVATRISELKALQAQLKELRNQCVLTRSNSQCCILQGLSGADNVETNKGETHMNGCH